MMDPETHESCAQAIQALRDDVYAALYILEARLMRLEPKPTRVHAGAIETTSHETPGGYASYRLPDGSEVLIERREEYGHA